MVSPVLKIIVISNNNDDLINFNIVHRPDNIIVYLVTNPNILVFHACANGISYKG